VTVQKVVPQNLDAEEMVLGAILAAGALGAGASVKVIASVQARGLKARDFYRASPERHA
jgi:replicative DNA helicase